MKTVLIFFLIFSTPSTYAFLSYYPESTLLKFQNKNTKSKDLKEEIFNLSNKFHLVYEGKNDTLSDFCPRENDTSAKCLSQKTDLTYEEARRILFGELFLEHHEKESYTVKDVYCNIEIDETKGAGPKKIPNPKYMNCEHTWPQSKFSKNFPNELQKTDLHHLFPVDMRANSTRNNHPFADVNGKVTHSNCHDSKLGTALDSNIISFEPPPEHKGNVARAIYYFSTRYKMNLDSTQEKYLKIWNKLDPVDQEEMDRNEKIMKIQGNRNPFVDHPELIDRL